MAHRRPYIFVNIVKKAWDSTQVESQNSRDYPSYRELLKELPELINSSIDKEVTVYRQRRGEWGEWFERFILDENNKLKIIKKGWL